MYDATISARELPIGLVGARRFVGGALGDLRAVSRALLILPEIAHTLREIRADVRSLDSEVKQMRESVGTLETQVADVRRALRPLSRLRDRA